MAIKGIARTISKLSLGLVLILFWGWMYLRADLLFPVNTEAMKEILQTYMLFTALIFSFDALASRKTERPLFEVRFIKEFPKFLLAGFITLSVLFLFGLTLKGSALPSVFEAVSKIGLGVILLHALFVATLEEKIFRGWLPNELRARGIEWNAVWVIQALVFAFFHYLLNGEWLSILVYIPLAFIFMYVKLKFTPRTDMANAGVHFAWNMFVLGFMS